MKRKIYNIKVSSEMLIIRKIKNNQEIITICEKYQKKMFEKANKNKNDKNLSCDFISQSRRRSLRKVRKNIARGFYDITKKEFEMKPVSIKKEKIVKEDSRINELFLNKKDIKQYYFKKKDLIEFLSIIIFLKEIPIEFLEMKDVKFILRQLNLMGIYGLIEYLNNEEMKNYNN